MKIAYYISSHGFGHISRSFELVREILEKPRLTKLFLITTRTSFLNGFEHPKLVLRNIATDLGVAQKNSIDVDLDLTKAAIQDFENHRENLTSQEKRFLEEEKIDLVFSDISSFPHPISKSVGIPSYFIGNFTWDFIYENYNKYDIFFYNYAKKLKEEYSMAVGGFLLPFSCPVEPVLNLKKVGILGRKNKISREITRKQVDFRENEKYFLFSFGAYGLGAEQFHFQLLNSSHKIVISGLEGFQSDFVRDIRGIYYPDLVAACDYVVTKPGYGVLSETYLCKTPLLYTDRGKFAEYPYLVDAMNIFHRAAYINHSELYSLHFSRAIEEIELQTNRFEILEDGKSDILVNFF